MDGDIFLVQNGVNLGFGAGVNVGLHFALSQSDMTHAWVLNNDTEVSRNSLREMLIEIECAPDRGICGSKLVSFSERSRIQGVAGIYRPMFCRVSEYGRGVEVDSEADDQLDVARFDYVIGASMLFKRSFLMDVGLFGEEYFLYFEELDLAFRAKKKGYSQCVSLKSIVYHKEGASARKGGGVVSDYYANRSRLIFTKKYNKNYVLTVRLWLVASFFKRILMLDIRKAYNLWAILIGIDTVLEK